MTRSNRYSAGLRGERGRAQAETSGFDETELREIEARYAEGMSVQQVVEVFTSRGARLTEATFRKYVQLGLLPRSVRVGRKGKHRGSQGLYPATAIRQIDLIRRLMGQGFTMEEIQRDFLFVRGDIVALGRQLDRVCAAIDDAVNGDGEADALLAKSLEDVREKGAELIEGLEDIERRLLLRARMARAVV